MTLQILWHVDSQATYDYVALGITPHPTYLKYFGEGCPMVDLEPELMLRLRPLREQWEARGPGLWKHLVRILPFLDHDSVVVRLVLPISGGGGGLGLGNQLYFEGVLANPLEFLPEVVRLAWWISLQQIQHQQHPIAEQATNLLSRSDMAYAMIPPVLEAAERVELTTLSESTVAMAAANWLPNSVGSPENPSRANSLYSRWLNCQAKNNLTTPLQLLRCYL